MTKICEIHIIFFSEYMQVNSTYGSALIRATFAATQ